MRQRIHGRTFRQVRRARREFLQHPDLCLGRLLPHQQVAEALRRHPVVFRDYPKEQVAAAYRARWQAELDLRAIKQVLAMEILRCKTPAMVRKEIGMHLLAYNLIRTLLADAAQTVGAAPRELSFTGALQTLNAFAPVWSSGTVAPEDLYATILHAMPAIVWVTTPTASNPAPSSEDSAHKPS